MTVEDALEQADRWHMPSPDTWALDTLADEVRRLRGLLGEPLRLIAVEAIREATGCPDIKGLDGELLTEKLLAKAKELLETLNVKVSGPEAALSPEGRARLPGCAPDHNGE